MQLLIMFMVGYLLPTTQLHLLKYGVKEENSGYWFSINTFCYFFSSFLVSLIPQNASKPKQMLLGNFIMVFALIFIGPCPFILPEKLVFIGIGLMLVGFAGGFIYGKKYLVPSMPHMLEVARSDYGYENDHRLNDAASGITNISLCTGEILGPIVSAVLDTFLGYSMAATVVAIVTLVHALNYMVSSDAVTYKNVKGKTHNKILISELISMNHKTND